MFKKITGIIKFQNGKLTVKFNHQDFNIFGVDMVTASDRLIKSAIDKKDGEKIDGYIFTGVTTEEVEDRNWNLILKAYTLEEIKEVVNAL